MDALPESMLDGGNDCSLIDRRAGRRRNLGFGGFLEQRHEVEIDFALRQRLQRLAAEVEKERATLEAQIAETLGKAKSDIAESKSKALAGIDGIATELADIIVRRLIGKEIATDRVGVFRQELSGEQIEVLERLGKQALLSRGYPLDTDGERPLPLSFLVKLTYDLSRFALRLPWRSVLRELLGRLFLDGRPMLPAHAPLSPAAQERTPRILPTRPHPSWSHEFVEC